MDEVWTTDTDTDTDTADHILSIPLRKHFACPYCGKRYDQIMGRHNELMEKEFDRCCPGRGELACLPDNATRNSKDDLKGCEKYRQAFSMIEVAMNCEMGLYHQFDVENGMPKNCSGLEEFNLDHWDDGLVAWDVDCPLNMRSLPVDDIPVSSIMAEYASDQVTQLSATCQPIILFLQDRWIRDFIKTFEKMMKNGYEESDLTQTPGSWWNVGCLNENEKIVCSYPEK